MNSIMKGLIASFDVDHNLYQLHFVNNSQALMYNIKINSYYYVDYHQCLRIIFVDFIWGSADVILIFASFALFFFVVASKKSVWKLHDYT